MSIKVLVAEAKQEDMKIIISALLSDSNFEIVGKATSGQEVISKAKSLDFKVIIISTSLQDMTLFQIVKEIMDNRPKPILVMNPEHQPVEGKSNLIRYGIIDWFTISIKNRHVSFSDVALTTRCHILAKLNLGNFKDQINHVNSTVSHTTRLTQSMHRISQTIEEIISVGPSNTPWVIQKPISESLKPISTEEIFKEEKYSGLGRANKIIIIGTSTGGPKLLNEIVPRLPANLPPVLLIQHMPVGFTHTFADRLNRRSKVHVKQAEDGDDVVSGVVYIAPAGYHLELLQSTTSGPTKIQLADGDMVNFVKPSIDVAIKSAVKIYKQGVVGVILTGMGHDGRDGCKVIKQLGGKVIVLHETDSDIYGMNRSVIEAGYADQILRKRELIGGIVNAIEN